MRVACLVIAYVGAPVLARSLPVYRAAGWDIFVHVDRKVSQEAYAAELGDAQRECTFVAEPEEVFWGGFSMMRAELKLIEAALSANHYDKFVLLSDDAFPILPPDGLNRHLSGDDDLITLVRQNQNSDFYARYHRFFYYDHPATMMRGHGSRSTEIDARFEDKIAEIAIFRRLGKKQLTVFHGSQFWALTADSVALILDRIKNDMHLVKSFEYSALSDELMIQSILGNYKYNGDIRRGLVYADFQFVPGPRIIRAESDLPPNLPPDFAFVRKWDPKSTTALDHMLARLMSGCMILGSDAGVSVGGEAPPAEAEIINVHLTAPAEVAGGAWHGVEKFSDRPYRWTRLTRIAWRLPSALPKGRVRFSIPVLMSVKADYLDKCSLAFQGGTELLQRSGASLFAEFKHDGSSVGADVVLTTPPPLSPRQLWGRPDDRELGIAVAVQFADAKPVVTPLAMNDPR